MRAGNRLKAHKMEMVLILDDDRDFLEMSRVGLGYLGLDVETYADPHRAREAFFKDPRRYTAVVTDVVMPSMSGISFAAEIRAVSSSIPIVLISGMTETLDDAMLAPLGDVDVLTKPITPRGLANAVLRHRT